MPKTTLWLVCNASRAHLFREDPRAHRFEMVASFEHPESRSHVSDLVADTQSQTRKPAPPEAEPKEVEAQKFARELGAAIEHERFAKPDEAVGLVAPPHFLGLIRGVLGERGGRRVEVSIDKDLAVLAPREIERRLRAERAL
jgi:protein required for attachment to host cells